MTSIAATADAALDASSFPDEISDKCVNGNCPRVANDKQAALTTRAAFSLVELRPSIHLRRNLTVSPWFMH
eukprot:4687025-Amphidinium_carterae.2